MRQYLSADFFSDQQFPLTAALAQQRQFMLPHCHDFIEIVLVTRGSTIHEVCFPGRAPETYGLIRGDLFAIMPGVVHSYQASRHLELYNIALELSAIASELPDLLALPGCRTLLTKPETEICPRVYLEPAQRQLAMEHLRRMTLYERLNQPAGKLRIKTAFLDFLFAIGSAEEKKFEPSGSTVQSAFLDSLDYIEQNPAQEITLKKLSRIANMSISSYTSKFRALIGLSPLDYCIHLRLTKARKLLLDSKLSLSEIAVECGFYDSNYLIKLFRQREGITPAKLRKLSME